MCVPSRKTCHKQSCCACKDVQKTYTTKCETWRHGIPWYIIKTELISGITVLDIDFPNENELSGYDFLAD